MSSRVPSVFQIPPEIWLHIAQYLKRKHFKKFYLAHRQIQSAISVGAYVISRRDWKCLVSNFPECNAEIIPYVKLLKGSCLSIILFRAIKSRNPDFVLRFLSQCQDLSEREIDLEKLVDCALQYNEVEIVKLLMTDTAVSWDSSFLRHALYEACHVGCKEILEILIQKHGVISQDVKLELKDEYSFKARNDDHGVFGRHEGLSLISAMFIEACGSGHLEIVNYLLGNQNLDPASYDYLALDVAVAREQPPVVKRLLEIKTIPRSHLDCVFYLACQHGESDVVECLLKDARVNPASDESEAFEAAYEKRHLEVVRLLMEDSRVDPRMGWFPACRAVNVELLGLLLKDPRVNPADHGNLAFKIACRGKHIDIIRLLMQDPRFDSGVALFHACREGLLEVVEILLEYPRTNLRANQYRAFKIACKRGFICIIRKFLRNPRFKPSKSVLRYMAGKCSDSVVGSILRDYISKNFSIAQK